MFNSKYMLDYILQNYLDSWRKWTRWSGEWRASWTSYQDYLAKQSPCQIWGTNRAVTLLIPKGIPVLKTRECRRRAKIILRASPGILWCCRPSLRTLWPELWDSLRDFCAVPAYDELCCVPYVSGKHLGLLFVVISLNCC